jgi:hypothetical protein
MALRFRLGTLFYHGKPSGPQEKIKAAGTYAWMLLTPADPAYPRNHPVP